MQRYGQMTWQRFCQTRNKWVDYRDRLHTDKNWQMKTSMWPKWCATFADAWRNPDCCHQARVLYDTQIKAFTNQDGQSNRRMCYQLFKFFDWYCKLIGPNIAESKKTKSERWNQAEIWDSRYAAGPTAARQNPYGHTEQWDGQQQYDTYQYTTKPPAAYHTKYMDYCFESFYICRVRFGNIPLTFTDGDQYLSKMDMERIDNIWAGMHYNLWDIPQQLVDPARLNAESRACCSRSRSP